MGKHERPAASRPVEQNGRCLFVVPEYGGVRTNRDPDVVDSDLVDDSVQRFDGSPEIGDAPVEELDLLLEMRDTLVIGGSHARFLVTVQTSASPPFF